MIRAVFKREQRSRVASSGNFWEWHLIKILKYIFLSLLIRNLCTVLSFDMNSRLLPEKLILNKLKKSRQFFFLMLSHWNKLDDRKIWPGMAKI